MAYKQSPRSPLAKALKGNQHKLPQHLQDAIKAAPESPAKQTISKESIKENVIDALPIVHAGKMLKKGVENQMDVFGRAGYSMKKEVSNMPKKATKTKAKKASGDTMGRLQTKEKPMGKKLIEEPAGKAMKKEIRRKKQSKVNLPSKKANIISPAKKGSCGKY